MNVDKLNVYYDDRLVGILALSTKGKVAFEYDDAWIETGFSISPFSLPLEKKVFLPEKSYFNGLFGVFADSLPDAWGNLLVNRLLRKNGFDLGNISVLDRLAIVGDSGMGALTYRPEIKLISEKPQLELDYLAKECKKLLNTEYSEELDGLYRLGGTSGGARPKILTQIQGEEWIIKFPAHVDDPDIGSMEYLYSKCAKACGIEMSECRLFPSNTCGGYFGTRRFDRSITEFGNKRIHMLTVAAILEVDYQQPSLDYHTLMKLTKILTRDSSDDLKNMFRRMCFNVFAHNRDDHSKNFTFVYDESNDKWRLGPAYDLTYSTTYFGEHTTSVDGNGRNPGARELLAVGSGAGLKKKWCEQTIAEIEHTIKEYNISGI